MLLLYIQSQICEFKAHSGITINAYLNRRNTNNNAGFGHCKNQSTVNCSQIFFTGPVFKISSSQSSSMICILGQADMVFSLLVYVTNRPNQNPWFVASPPSSTSSVFNSQGVLVLLLRSKSVKLNFPQVILALYLCHICGCCHLRPWSPYSAQW